MSSSNKSSSKSISSGNCSIFSGILSHISETLSKASAQGAPLLRQVISSDLGAFFLQDQPIWLTQNWFKSCDHR